MMRAMRRPSATQLARGRQELNNACGHRRSHRKFLTLKQGERVKHFSKRIPAGPRPKPNEDLRSDTPRWQGGACARSAIEVP
eukprot:9461504-Pyramimonas_sp.AAC.2